MKANTTTKIITNEWLNNKGENTKIEKERKKKKGQLGQS